jgi:hypothetical protein
MPVHCPVNCIRNAQHNQASNLEVAWFRFKLWDGSATVSIAGKDSEALTRTAGPP